MKTSLAKTLTLTSRTFIVPRTLGIESLLYTSRAPHSPRDAEGRNNRDANLKYLRSPEENANGRDRVDDPSVKFL